MHRLLASLLTISALLALSLPVSALAKEYFVCYKSRHDTRTQDRLVVKYVGCVKSHTHCAQHNERYFGTYKSRQQAEAAYSRCIHSSPRHID